MVDAGTLVYYAGVKELAHFAGVYDDDAWRKFNPEDPRNAELGPGV